MTIFQDCFKMSIQGVLICLKFDLEASLHFGTKSMIKSHGLKMQSCRYTSRATSVKPFLRLFVYILCLSDNLFLIDA